VKPWQLFTLILTLFVASIVINLNLPPMGKVAWLPKVPIQEGLDIKGGVRVVLQAEPEPGKTLEPGMMDEVRAVLDRRVNQLGVSGSTVSTKGERQIVVELPGATNSDEAINRISRTAKLEIRYLRDLYHQQKNPSGRYTMDFVPANPNDPKARDLYTFTDRTTNKPIPLEEIRQSSPLITDGSHLLPRSRQDFQGAEVVVSFEMDSVGAKAFGDFTQAHVGEVAAIFLDKEIITAPTINTPILDGKGIIEGNFRVKEAQVLAQLLNSGALPVSLRQEQVQQVSATLGRDSVQRSIIAGLSGLALVLLFMIAYYWLPGLVACIALLIYASYTFAIYKLMGVVMDLPGITGFILSVGMAVDANILIFERTKEELRAGRSLTHAVREGFNRAFTSIFDSNMTTWITCAILYFFGTNLIKGFALTLAIGVAVSMFTAITATRTMMFLMIGKGIGTNPRAYALNFTWLSRRFGEGGALNVYGQRRFYWTLSLLVTLPGLLAIAAGQLRPGIDFTGGGELTVQPSQSISVVQARAAATKAGITEPQVVTVSPPMGQTVPGLLIRSQNLTNDNKQAVLDTLARETGARVNLLAFDKIGGTIARELTRNAVTSIVLASVLIVAFLTIRFAIGGYRTGLKFGICAVIALIHDVITVMGIFAIMGYLRGWQVDTMFVTAMLTVIGFSVHDTIVVYDRIREHLRQRQKGESFEHISNLSITETFDRSINTGMSVIFVLLALIVFGGSTVRQFNAALLIGILVGTYSSIFVAAPLIVLWNAWETRRTAARAGTTPERPAPTPRVTGTPQPAGAGARAAAPPVPRGAAPSGDGAGSPSDAGRTRTVRPKPRGRRR
jgi:SecD/SecF fusion protein